MQQQQWSAAGKAVEEGQASIHAPAMPEESERGRQPGALISLASSFWSRSYSEKRLVILAEALLARPSAGDPRPDDWTLMRPINPF